MAQSKHRLSRIRYQLCVDAATGGKVEVVCDRCGRHQPNAHADDLADRERWVGCLMCGHPTGTYA